MPGNGGTTVFKWLRRGQAARPGADDPARLLANADTLRLVAMRSADPRSLQLAIVAADLATRECPDPADQAVAWSMLCVLNREAATRGGGHGAVQSRLDAAEQAGRHGLSLVPDGSEQWFRCASALGTVLLERHLRLGDSTALPEAVELNRRIVAELDLDSPEYPGALGNLTNALKLLYGVSQDQALIEEAVVTAREAVELVGPDSPHYAIVRINLASAIAVQLSHTPSRALLDEARGHLRTALAELPAGHPHRPVVQTLAAQLDRGTEFL